MEKLKLKYSNNMLYTLLIFVTSFFFQKVKMLKAPSFRCISFEKNKIMIKAP